MTSLIEREKRTVELMIRLYCRRKEGNKQLCNECRELLDYAHTRLDNCHFGEGKSGCNHCPIHCYKQDMREKIRRVMRFSGPRMIIYTPIELIRHMIGR